MATPIDSLLREQLLDRRGKLEGAIAASRESEEVLRLLREVDAALDRVDQGTYGLCKACHDPIESERLIADPLVQFCLGHLTPFQQRALEEDLELACRIQRALLPLRTVRSSGWEASYHYEAAGLIGGDYCDLVDTDSENLYFIIGDVTGKGVAASMLMAHLHAMFRALVSLRLPLDQLVERASRVFCESTLPTHFATLVCGRAGSSGEVEICNAGHLPPLLLHRGEVERIDATGLPIGIFCDERFSVNHVELSRGDAILLYTDGLSEARDESGVEYGTERVSKFLSEHYPLPPEELISACMEDLKAFRSGAPKTDDLTLMAIRRVE